MESTGIGVVGECSSHSRRCRPRDSNRQSCFLNLDKYFKRLRFLEFIIENEMMVAKNLINDFKTAEYWLEGALDENDNMGLRSFSPLAFVVFSAQSAASMENRLSEMSVRLKCKNFEDSSRLFSTLMTIQEHIVQIAVELLRALRQNNTKSTNEVGQKAEDEISQSEVKSFKQTETSTTAEPNTKMCKEPETNLTTVTDEEYVQKQLHSENKVADDIYPESCITTSDEEMAVLRELVKLSIKSITEKQEVNGLNHQDEIPDEIKPNERQALVEDTKNPENRYANYLYGVVLGGYDIACKLASVVKGFVWSTVSTKTWILGRGNSSQLDKGDSPINNRILEQMRGIVSTLSSGAVYISTIYEISPEQNFVIRGSSHCAPSVLLKKIVDTTYQELLSQIRYEKYLVTDHHQILDSLLACDNIDKEAIGYVVSKYPDIDAKMAAMWNSARNSINGNVATAVSKFNRQCSCNQTYHLILS